MSAAASRPARLQVIVGATRPGRVGPTVAAWFHGIAVAHGGFDVELVDLVEVGLPLLDEPENPARGGTYRHAHTKAWSATVTRADAFVWVLPEYNNGYNAATKNAVDYLFHEWRDKAAGIVSYGGNVGAGTRATQAFKHVLLAVGAMPVHEAVNIPFIYTTLDGEGRFTGNAVLDGAASTMLDALVVRADAGRFLRGTLHEPEAVAASAAGAVGAASAVGSADRGAVR